jgi:hypothetical protein
LAAGDQIRSVCSTELTRLGRIVEDALVSYGGRAGYFLSSVTTGVAFNCPYGAEFVVANWAGGSMSAPERILRILELRLRHRDSVPLSVNHHNLVRLLRRGLEPRRVHLSRHLRRTVIHREKNPRYESYYELRER